MAIIMKFNLTLIVRLYKAWIYKFIPLFLRIASICQQLINEEEPNL